MINATISADIIKSTSLSKDSVVLLQDHLKRYIDALEHYFHGAWGRIVRGDSVECVIPNARDALRVALMLKSHVKAFGAEPQGKMVQGIPHARFSRYGVRIAIGIGTLRTNDTDSGIIDGKAIYNSGRALDGMSSRMRANLVISGFRDARLPLVQAMLNLADELLTHATAKQCQVIALRLRGISENEIATSLGITQPAVNKHLRSAGWYALANAVQAFEEVL